MRIAPRIKKAVSSSIRRADHLFSGASLKLFQERNAVLTFLFHGLFRDVREADSGAVDPMQRTTVEDFRKFVRYFLECGYKFTSPDEILKGLDASKRYVLATFDDGYFNNIHILPVLKEYSISAVFFISTNYVEQNKCFWWDVLYRERARLGASIKEIKKEQEAMKLKTNAQIEEYLMKLFGQESFRPKGDIDRPFAPSELRDFSREKGVVLGNHTLDHAILTNYPPDGIRSQITGAQNAIRDISGKRPVIISYPNGNYSAEVIKASEEAGLRLGLTTVPKKNYLPIDGNNGGLMRLGRFMLNGSDGIKQYELFRSDIAAHNLKHNLFGRSR